MRFLTFGVLYTLIYLTSGFALRAYPYARTIVADTLLMILALAICAVVFRRRRQWAGTHLLFWDAAAVGYLLWCVGEVGFAMTSVTGRPVWVQWHTMFSLCGGIGPVVALLARPHRGSRKADAWPIGIDLASYATLMGFVYAYFIMVPSVVPADGRPSPQSTLLTLVQVQRFVLFVGLAGSAWFARNTPWGRTFRVLAMATGVGFVLRWFTSLSINTDRYYEGSVYDLAWIVPYMAYLWAARESPSSSAHDPDLDPPRGGWRTAIVSAAPVLLIPTIGFGLLRVQPMPGTGDSMRLLLTIMSMVAGLGLLTLRLSVQSGELARADAQMRLLAAATEQTADLILITDSHGRFVHANDACVHALGYARAELQGMTLPALLDPGVERMVDPIGTEVRQRGIWRGTLIHRRKNGQTFPVSSTVVALRSSDGRVTHFVGVQRDITDELKLRDQLVHSERLSAVGELVAGVAHEISNPLQTIIGSVELMLQEPAADHRGDLQMIRHEASRAGQIVRNLLAFVRKSSSDRIRADLNQIARAVAALREHHLAQCNIDLRLDLCSGVLPVLVNREEIQQVVLNLVLNAEHAIGDGAGAITIRTVAEEHAQTLQVMDDGPGISPELRGRVFEPFFTTKEVGQGTGLGLSLALGIARAHGGALELLDSARGATFRLTLPAAPQAAASQSTPAAPSPDHQAPSPEHQAPSTTHGAPSTEHRAPTTEHRALSTEHRAPSTEHRALSTEHRALRETRRALVIEDEAPIRDLLARLLTRRDYRVIEASSCCEARAVSDGVWFDLVLCDVRLEDGNGADCLRHLAAAQPAIERRFIWVTGDSGALSIVDPEMRDIPVLTKPFTVTDLDRVLGDVAVGV